MFFWTLIKPFGIMPLYRYRMMLNMANYEKLYEKDYQKLLNKYDKKSDEYKLCKIFCRYKNAH